MTEKNINPGTDTFEDERDPVLEQELHAAYDAMDPTPEQEERMLAALLAAQEAAHEADAAGLADAEGEQDAAAESGAPEAPKASGIKEAATSNTAANPAANRSRTIKPWKVALPLAACLVAGAVVIGIAGQGSNAANVASSGSATSTTTLIESAKSPDASTTSSKRTEALSTEEMAEDVEMEYMAADGAMANGAATEVGMQSDVYYDDVYMKDDFNTEEYDAVEERGFISTKTSPLSTVSADVDTASYCNLRRMINSGTRLDKVPTGAVRIEEMLNYFDYDYKAPTGDDKFSMQAQSSTCPWNPDTQLLVLGFATAQEAKAAEAGSNLVFLVDVSGSMNSPDKLDLLQDSFATLLENLGPKDRVSIVTYANGEEIVLEGASGDDEKEIMRAIYKLHADGSTNGEAGLKQAYEVAERNFIKGGVNRIIMASDGDLNVGISSESDLYDFVDKKRESGVYLSVLGFGSGNYKDNKMETLADHGNGSYHYIDCIEEAERVLKDKLTANLVPFADDVKVQVEFNPAQVKAYRLIGYENRAIADEDFRNDAVDAGDVGPNSQFTVAYEVVLADSKMDVPQADLKYGADSGKSYGNSSSDWLTCTMRYHVFDGDEMREQQLVVDSTNETASPSDDWNFAAAVIEFGMLARDSKYAGTSSFDSIMDLLGSNLNDERDGFKRLVAKAS